MSLMTIASPKYLASLSHLQRLAGKNTFHHRKNHTKVAKILFKRALNFCYVNTVVREKMCAGYETLDIYRPYGTLRTWGLLFVLPVFCPCRGSPVRDKILVESIVGFFIKSR